MGEMYKRLYRLKQQTRTENCDWIERFIGSTKFEHAYDDDRKAASQEVSKVTSQLRKAFEKSGILGLESLVPLRNRAVTFPVDRIHWRNKEKLLDICGYLFYDIETINIV